MKHIFLFVIFLITLNCTAQTYLLKSNQDCFETGLIGGAKGSSFQIGFQTINYDNPICGFGAFGIISTDYTSLKKSSGTNISSNELIPGIEKSRIESRGNTGWGIGGRLIFKYGFAVEAGYLNYKFKQNQVYQSPVTGSEYNISLQDMSKEGYFVKALFLPRRMKLSFGVSYSSIEKLGGYVGYRF